MRAEATRSIAWGFSGAASGMSGVPQVKGTGDEVWKARVFLRSPGRVSAGRASDGGVASELRFSAPAPRSGASAARVEAAGSPRGWSQLSTASAIRRIPGVGTRLKPEDGQTRRHHGHGVSESPH